MHPDMLIREEVLLLTSVSLIRPVRLRTSFFVDIVGKPELGVRATPVENSGIFGEFAPKPTSSSGSTSKGREKKQNDLVSDKSFLCNTIVPDYRCHEFDFTDEYYEYEQGQADILVKGRLKARSQFWKSIGANSFILDVIEHGYKIPFYSKPENVHLNNNKSALFHSEFVTQSIIELEKKGLILRCREKPFVVNPLTVSEQSNGKKRLILDLRIVNNHLWKEKVKFEDIRTALLYVNKGCWMYKFDIHSAYHHIDIFPEHTKFWGFS